MIVPSKNDTFNRNSYFMDVQRDAFSVLLSIRMKRLLRQKNNKIYSYTCTRIPKMILTFFSHNLIKGKKIEENFSQAQKKWGRRCEKKLLSFNNKGKFKDSVD
jgi:hypothetical protein